MLINPYHLACVSDIHLFHARTPTRRILEELRLAFPDNEETAKLDTIYIAGDIYDHLVNYPASETMDVELYIKDLLRLCKKHDIQLRILEGTPGHDWKQSKRFDHINRISGINADVKYFDDLAIEYNEKYGIHALYIPDEHDVNPENTLKQVRELMEQLGIDKVDLAIMHGQFHYQLPAVSKAPKHNEDAYLDLVRYYIFIGHVHTHSTYKNIVAQGSFSRLKHAEEEAKGHVRATLYPDGNKSCRFIENTLATKYVTVDVRGLEAADGIKKVQEVSATLPDDSYIRIHCLKTDAILAQQNYDSLLRDPRLIWSKPKVDDELSEDESLDTLETGIPEYHAITITQENLWSLLKPRLEVKLDVVDLQKANDIVNRIIET